MNKIKFKISFVLIQQRSKEAQLKIKCIDKIKKNKNK